jgi:twitching motility protein PilT
MRVSKAASSEEVSIVDLLRLIVDKGGSDLHITVGSPPMLRLQGKLWPTDMPALAPKDVQRLVLIFWITITVPFRA